MAESFFPEEDVRASAENPPPQNHTDSESPLQPPPAADELNSDESRLAALIAYIPFLCFIPLLNMRENKVALFHARQGTILFLIELAAAILLVDGISDFIFKAVLVGAVVLAAVGIYFALQGKSVRLPLIGDLADKTKL
jgi:uncharacterized membrane protein